MELIGSKKVDLETLYQATNRLSALVEQYDAVDQSQARIEMETEILNRIPANKRKGDITKQIQDQIDAVQIHRDAVLQAIRDITAKDIGDLRQRVTDLKLA